MIDFCKLGQTFLNVDGRLDYQNYAHRIEFLPESSAWEVTAAGLRAGIPEIPSLRPERDRL